MSQHPSTRRAHPPERSSPPQPQPRRTARTAAGLALTGVLLAVLGTPTAVSRAAEPPFDVALSADGRSDPNTWPDACQTLTDAEIKSFVPKAGQITRKGQNGTLPGGGQTKQFVQCKYETPLATDTSSGTPSHLTVILEAVAQPDLVAQEYGRRKQSDQKLNGYKDYGTGLGSDGCHWQGTLLSCHTAKYLFKVDGFEYRQDADRAQTELAWRDGPMASAVKTLSAKMR